MKPTTLRSVKPTYSERQYRDEDGCLMRERVKSDGSRNLVMIGYPPGVYATLTEQPDYWTNPQPNKDE